MGGLGVEIADAECKLQIRTPLEDGFGIEIVHAAQYVLALIATVVIWFLKNFDLHLTLTDDPEKSILAVIAGFFAPVMQPIGLGDWRMLVSLITGFMAKESVVSSFEVLYPDNALLAVSSLSAVCMLVFSLLYTPCVAAIAAIRRELGLKWAAAVVLWQCAVAWLITLLVHAIGMMIGAG